MSLLRALTAILGIGLAGLIVWAIFFSGSSSEGLHGDIWQQGGVILTLPWGQVAMADLYVGFVLFAVVIGLTEKSWVSAAFWIAPLFFLGNVWSAVWLVVRLPDLAARLSRPDWPTS
ncbi:MAG: hypothetical protein KGS44_03180 [Alphaproteobacteria bacterium]|jgi:hypothetical protein|nr:hypothetical protein [Alphaproteobacteria bacterium]